MHQTKYARDLLKTFDMQYSNYANTPIEVGLKLEKNHDEGSVDPTQYRSIVGSLCYLCNTRPDLSFNVGLVSRYMQEPKVSHLLIVKCILRYLHGTEKLRIYFFVERE